MRDPTEVVADVRSIWRDGRGAILLAVAAGWFLSIGVRMVYPVLLPHLRTAYELDLAVAGLLLTVLWVAYALGQLPGGVLADNLGEGRILVASTGLSAVTIALVATAGSPLLLFGATGSFGFATALYGVARYTAISTIFEENDGAAIGVTLAAGDVGNVVLPPAAGFLAGAIAWQLGFGVTVPLFAGVTAALWLALPARTSGPSSAVDAVSPETIRYVLSGVTAPRIGLVATVQFLIFAAWQAFTGFYPTYLIEEKGISPAIATTLFGSFFALGIAVKPLSGATADRFGARVSLAIVVGAGAVGLAALPLVSGIAPLVGVTVLTSGLLGVTVITMSSLTRELPPDMRGTGLGFLRTVIMLLGAASPAVAGELADRGHFDEVFHLLAGLCAVAIVIVWLLPARRA